MRRAIACAVILLGAAPPVAPVLMPGEWHKLDHDGHALVDGVKRSHVPVGQQTAMSACLAPADAATPARWLLGEGGIGCEIDREDYTGGRVAIHATCPTPGGDKPGSLTATGVWTRDAIRVRFSSTSYGGGQTFGFNGVIDAHRIGACGAKPAHALPFGLHRHTD